jgi:hypothetical protein
VNGDIVGTSASPINPLLGALANTVTFKLYNNNAGTGTPLFTDTETLSNGTATSKGYTATATGTDYWVATYNGDSNNSTVTSSPSAEPVTISKASPKISTTQQPASATVGTSIADKATVTGYNPTGTVTFKLYNNNAGTGTPLFTDTETLSNGTATSKGYTTTATGTDYWVATYNGDSNNSTVTSSPSAEPVTINKAASLISTKAGVTSSTVGVAITDTATVTGYSPSGTVTFKLYNNATGTGTALYTSSPVTLTLTSGKATATTSYTPTAVGIDYWFATYSGDGKNYASLTSNPSTDKVTIASKAALQKTAIVGASILERATFSRGVVAANKWDLENLPKALPSTNLFDNHTQFLNQQPNFVH